MDGPQPALEPERLRQRQGRAHSSQPHLEARRAPLQQVGRRVCVVVVVLFCFFRHGTSGNPCSRS